MLIPSTQRVEQRRGDDSQGRCCWEVPKLFPRDFPMTGTLCSTAQTGRIPYGFGDIPPPPDSPGWDECHAPEMTPASMEQIPEGSSTKEGPRRAAGAGISWHYLGYPGSWSTSLPAEPSLGIKFSHLEFLLCSDSALSYQNWLIKGFPSQNCQQFIQTVPGDSQTRGLSRATVFPTVLCGVCGQRAPALTFWGSIAPGEKPAAQCIERKSSSEQRVQLKFRGQNVPELPNSRDKESINNLRGAGTGQEPHKENWRLSFPKQS